MKLYFSKNIMLIMIIGLFSACGIGKINIQSKDFIISDSVMLFFPHLQDSNYSCKDELVFYNSNAEKLDKPYVPSGFDMAYICLMYTYDNNQIFLKRKNELISKSKKELSPIEKEYNVMSSEDYLLKLYSVNNLIENFNADNEFFLPNFREIFDLIEPIKINNGTQCGLPTDYQIYIIEHDFSNVIDEAYEYKWDLLPEKYKCGYTSGVALSDSEMIIIYWVIAW